MIFNVKGTILKNVQFYTFPYKSVEFKFDRSISLFNFTFEGETLFAALFLFQPKQKVVPGEVWIIATLLEYSIVGPHKQVLLSISLSAFLEKRYHNSC